MVTNRNGFDWRSFSFYLTIVSTIVFLGALHLSMDLYSGGTLHERQLESYSFNYNFISDLGRARTPDGDSNFPANFVFRSAMTFTGVCIFFFFLALPGVFKNESAKATALIASVLGFAAGLSYIGLAWIPYDVSYRGHYAFVRTGFISFLLMSLFYAMAIFLEKGYPRRYGVALLLFSFILFSQILLMFLGERSWRSNDALFRQATAQKVVVYSEILCMLYQTFGALSHLRRSRA